MGRFSRAQAWAFPNMLNRLPEHYYRHRTELQKPSTRVHDRPPETDFFDLKYNDRVKRVERVPDVPIEVMYPKEADLGLWGGEGIVKGYVKPRKYFQAGWPRPKYFFPELKKAVLYSEILDKHFTFICTGRTLALVDEHHGLDGYILRTPVQDLKSQLALQLRREMLLTLLGKKKPGRDEAHGGEMRKKYADCVTTMPPEEAEWFGLSTVDALKKAKLETAKRTAEARLPLKYALSRKLIEDLKNAKDSIDSEPSKPTGWMDRVKSTLGLKTSPTPTT